MLDKNFSRRVQWRERIGGTMYNPDDLDLELRIDAAYRKFSKEPTQDNWRALTDLVTQRSPERVAEMEQQKGLR